ncbi:hypothetical protein [Microbacterium sp. Leaf179]|uniref:hypothetical protein n=1 Tax=Microbacterium sp. Leaf179 TaxID=1736288 RepID=UPI0007016113|nr:hypothetical protein [Microbacterium sp. Leaf179]KQR89086.1 hypothetical protein ASF96_04930 [Microbacterium sp. Leaf179]
MSRFFDLWDGSTGEVPPSYAGRSFTSTHDHYLASGAMQIELGDIEALITTIQEHGHGLRESNEQLIIMVNPAQMDAISSWRKGEANANGAVAKYDFIPATSAPAYLTDLTIVGDRSPSQFSGLALEGSIRRRVVDEELLRSGQLPDRRRDRRGELSTSDAPRRRTCAVRS